jgi:hypothetical protein
MDSPDPQRRDLSPDYWLERAKEVRFVATQMLNPRTKKLLESVAQSYEDMASLIKNSTSR